MKRLVMLYVLIAFLFILNFTIDFDKKQDTDSTNPFSPDYSDFVKINGIEYTARYYPVGCKLSKKNLGYQVGKVKYCLVTNPIQPRSGDEDGTAAYIGEGTPIYAVKGYNPNFRVASYEISTWIPDAYNRVRSYPIDSSLMLFQAYKNLKAQKGKDLFDIKGKVRYISINKGETELVVIKNRKKVKLLVNLTLEGDVIEPKGYVEGEVCYIVFHLWDGTTVVEYYRFWDSMLGYIKVSDVFAAEITEALNNKSIKNKTYTHK